MEIASEFATVADRPERTSRLRPRPLAAGSRRRRAGRTDGTRRMRPLVFLGRSRSGRQTSRLRHGAASRRDLQKRSAATPRARSCRRACTNYACRSAAPAAACDAALRSCDNRLRMVSGLKFVCFRPTSHFGRSALLLFRQFCLHGRKVHPIFSRSLNLLSGHLANEHPTFPGFFTAVPRRRPHICSRSQLFTPVLSCRRVPNNPSNKAQRCRTVMLLHVPALFPTFSFEMEA